MVKTTEMLATESIKKNKIIIRFYFLSDSAYARRSPPTPVFVLTSTMLLIPLEFSVVTPSLPPPFHSAGSHHHGSDVAGILGVEGVTVGAAD